MANPIIDQITLIRPIYGLEWRVSPHVGAGRVKIEAQLPTPVGVFLPFTDQILLHNAWYCGNEVNDTTPADEVLFNPSYFAYWGWLPIGTLITITVNPATENAVVVSDLCCDVLGVGPSYDSRSYDAVNLTRSTIRAITADAQTIAIQSHQFDSVSIGMVNTGAGIMAWTIRDAESGRIIAAGTVAAGASDTVVLTDELPDAIDLRFAAVANATGILTVKGNCL